MPFFTVIMKHPDSQGWNNHVKAHVEFLISLLEKNTLKASGPLKGLPLRAGFLIIQADNESQVEEIIAQDPFSKEDLIEELTITEWDPIFGAFAGESSRTVPPDLQDLVPQMGFSG